jgi:hypothetical protein
MSSAELVELRRRVDLAKKGMNLLLFGEPEAVSSKERRELKMRLGAYLNGRTSEFVELKDLQGPHSQRGGQGSRTAS